MKTRNCLVLHAVLYWVIWNQNIHQSELAELHISGKLRSSVTLPCSYDIDNYGLIPMCWGRGQCRLIHCQHSLLATDGKYITYLFGSKYQLYGDIRRGNLSLTIHDLNVGDEGLYCCRVKIPGVFNDKKMYFTLTVTPDRPFKCLSDYESPSSLEECQSGSRSQRTTSDATFCDFMNRTTFFNREVCKTSEANFPLQKVIEFSQSLLGNVTLWRSLEVKARQRAASRFLEVTESAVIAAALGLRSDIKTKRSSSTLDLEIGFVKRDKITGSDIMTLQAKENTVTAYSSTIIGDDDSAFLAFISYSNVESIFDAELLKEHSNSSRKLLKSQFNSKIVTVTKGNTRTHKLNGTVNITFQGKEEGVAGGRKVCAFWKARAKSGYWSTAGCQLMNWNETHTECSCNHLSSFAVLMALYDIMDPLHSSILNWITYLGLPVSMLCLLLSMGTFFCCKAIQNLNTTIRAHLCLSLFLAEVVFLTAISIDTKTVLCGIVAGGLHYLLLAAFAWMCLEAVQLCLMVLNLKVVNFSRTRIIPRRLMYPVGYGCPAVIVVMSAAVNHEGYGTDTLCWLDLKKGFLWSFLGPVCFVILVNTILFSTTLWILKEKISCLNADVSTINESRMLTFKAVAQFILLGCSWVFGLFQINEGTIVMSYLFTILNITQGLFIFCVHCLLNNQVRKEYWKCFIRICRPTKREMSDTCSSMLTNSKIMVQMTTDDPTTKPAVLWVIPDTGETTQSEEINH